MPNLDAGFSTALGAGERWTMDVDLGEELLEMAKEPDQFTKVDLAEIISVAQRQS